MVNKVGQDREVEAITANSYIFPSHLCLSYHGIRITIAFISVKVAGSDIEYDGYIEVPNLSDENEADEVDVSVFYLQLRHGLGGGGRRGKMES